MLSHWELLPLLVIYIAIPVSIIYFAVEAYKRLFRQLDEIQRTCAA